MKRMLVSVLGIMMLLGVILLSSSSVNAGASCQPWYEYHEPERDRPWLLRQIDWRLNTRGPAVVRFWTKQERYDNEYRKLYLPEGKLAVNLIGGGEIWYFSPGCEAEAKNLYLTVEGFDVDWTEMLNTGLLVRASTPPLEQGCLKETSWASKHTGGDESYWHPEGIMVGHRSPQVRYDGPEAKFQTPDYWGDHYLEVLDDDGNSMARISKGSITARHVRLVCYRSF